MIRRAREAIAYWLAPWLAAELAAEWSDIAEAWRSLADGERELQKSGRAMLAEAGLKEEDL